MLKLKLPLHYCMLEGCKNAEPILYASTHVHQHCLNPKSRLGSKRNCHACSTGSPSLSREVHMVNLLSWCHMYISVA